MVKQTSGSIAHSAVSDKGLSALPPFPTQPYHQPGTPRFVAPPPDEDEAVYPYRRAWPSLIAEHAVLFGVASGFYVLINFVGADIPASVSRPLNLGLALLPLALWLILSLWRERFVPQPRQRLFVVALTTALAANAVGIPLVEGFFEPSRWLFLGDNVSRIIGYTFTVGVTQEIIKYLVVRYLAWDDHFRDRSDGVAYGAASALGYALVLTLRFALENAPPPDVMAAYVFDVAATSTAGSLIVGFALAEVRFSRPTPFLLVGLVAFAALIEGAAVPIRANFVNASFTFDGAIPSPLFGIAVSAGVLIAAGVLVAFITRSAERQAREAAARAEV